MLFGSAGFSSSESALPLLVELHDAVRRGVGDPVAEDGRAVDVAEPAQPRAEPAAVEDVVAEHQADRLVADVVGADDERLREPVGAGLHGVGDRDAELRPVAEQPLERLGLVRRGDDQDVPDARQHQRGQRVVDHRLVVDRHQLLADGERDRVQA